jgi:branched-chain amino acid transport system substrate-binding protein
MKKAVAVLIGICVLMGGSIGVAFSEESGKEVIKIGCLFALSGPARHIGVPSKHVVVMAKDYFEEKGGIEGKQIELVFADTKGENSVTIREFERLVQREKVCAVIGPTRTGTCMALLRSIEKAKIPVVACVGGTPPVVPPREWVFKTPQMTVTAVEKICQYLKQTGIDKVAIITAKDAFGEEGRNDLRAVTGRQGIEIVAEESFGTADIDMSIQLRKLAATDAEAVICWTIGPAGATVARNFKSIGAKQILIQCHGLPDPTYLKLAGPAANGTFMPSTKCVVADQLPQDDPQREIVQSFVESYQKEYGAVSTHSGYAWDAFMIVANAIKKAGTDPEAMRDAIEETQGYIGISGIYNLSQEDHCGLGVDSLVMITVENGVWKIIE